MGLHPPYEHKSGKHSAERTYLDGCGNSRDNNIVRLRQHLTIIYGLAGGAILICAIVLLFVTTTGSPEESLKFWQGVAHDIILAVISLSAMFFAYLSAPRLKQYLVGPKLVMRVDSQTGTSTRRRNQQLTRYYHLRIENKWTFSPATNTVVRLIGFSKRQRNSNQFKEVPVDSLQFKWQWPDLVPRQIRLDYFYKCDICFANQRSDMVALELYEQRIGFPGFVRCDEAMRLKTIVAADNYVSKPHYYEILWNGGWSEDDEKMKEYLKFREVSSLT